MLELTVFEKRRKDAFTTVGFCDWNDASRKITRHAESESHIESALALNKHYSKPVDELLSETAMVNKKNNSHLLLVIIETIRYLARQNLPLRGLTVAQTAANPVSEPDSNLWQALLLQAGRDPSLGQLLKMKQTFTSPQVQNELLSLMSNSVLRTIVREIETAKWFSIMVDETTDISNQEQAAICIR